jgi:hypothetical protein
MVAKLSDFGTSVLIGDDEMLTDPVGTSGYTGMYVRTTHIQNAHTTH